jgi:hypothetical protein
MSLTQASQILTTHADVYRIHKLLYWVYTGQWPETMACLYQHPLKQLLEKLVQRTPTLKVLERRLYKAAAALTKPEDYQQLAALIVEVATLLYPEARPEARVEAMPIAEPTRLATILWDGEVIPDLVAPVTMLALLDNDSSALAVNALAVNNEEVAPTFILMPDANAEPVLGISPEPEVLVVEPVPLPIELYPVEVDTTPTRPSDRFALRQFLMQQAPPLKIKILLFSTLRHSFTFAPEDWKALKTQTLDVWLTELLETFPTIDRMEQQLFAQAASLKTLDQSMQIAETIVQAVRLQAP